MNTDKRIEDLMDASGELLTQLGDQKGPEIAALKTRLSNSIADIKQYLAKTAQQAGEQLKDGAVAVDDYVHESPWVAIGIAALVAASLGFAAGATRARPKKYLGLF
jgi:ElaB/YqjD/DUF883 family membrane-anchored ribosome-binding protein